MKSRSKRAAWRLTRDIVLPNLLTLLKGSALSDDDDPSLVSDLLDIVAEGENLNQLIACSLDEDLARRGGLFAVLWPDLEGRLPARGRHHLALLSTSWGWSCLLDEPVMVAEAWRHWKAALKHWAAVLASSEYCLEFVPASADDSEAGTREAGLARWILDPHFDAILDGMDEAGFENSDRLSLHWRVLVEAASVLDEASDGRGERKSFIGDVASGMRRDIVERVLSFADEMSRPIEPIVASIETLRLPFERLSEFTRVCGMNEEISVWAIERSVEWAWPLYKTNATEKLEGLLEASRPFATNIEAVLMRGVGAFGRQGVCADHIIFQADFESKAKQPDFFRRALRVCPGHRNSRLMLSHHFIHLARGELSIAERSSALGEMGALDARAVAAAKKAKTFIDEAEEIFPPNESLAAVRDRQVKAFERLKLDIGDGVGTPGQ